MIAVDTGWIERWRAAAARLVDGFEARHGFAPAEHEVSGPATGAELAGLTDDLVTFYRVVAGVRLPDVGNGYWIRRPGDDSGREAEAA
ncbi:hypothetical protein KOI35_17760 [Actinoplanes bogorensis]|uniref:Uncharacterized protein n=1 Tax=Paractinoplanes bogorensis TaxID=1610840 RepID=A0ABS5YTH8_9ACTN|nr:hypothetical protein [Actinoplanes bogorensis]MBU2665355.1 hypothetical protein [Actinoplanes bogorensis]